MSRIGISIEKVGRKYLSGAGGPGAVVVEEWT